MKDTLKFVLAFSLAAALGFAGSIKVWGTNDVLTAADLNANFAHIHNLMVGGHGARLVNADVAPNANIAYTKIATNPYIPRAWGYGGYLCPYDGGTCPVTASSGITSIQKTNPTTTVVTFSTGYPVDTVMTTVDSDTATCTVHETSSTVATIECAILAGAYGGNVRVVRYAE